MIIPFLALIALAPPRIQIGTSWSGEETLHFSSKLAEINETHRFALSFRVTGLEDKMWTVDRKSMLVSTIIDGTEIPGSTNQDASVIKEWLSPAGFLLGADPYDRGAFALDRMLHFWLPTNIPDEWSADLSTSLDHVVAKARAEFRRITRADGPILEYSLNYQAANDLTAKGRMRFDVKSGRLLYARINAQRALLPGGMDRADVILTYTDSRTTKPLK
jgi:hypothetical protein